MQLADVEKLVVKHTGLVPMKVIRDFAPYKRNTPHGFPPKMALEHFKNGDAVFLAQPHLRPEAVQVTNPRGESGPISAAGAPDVQVEIPANWETTHHLKRIFLAGKIRGGDAATTRGMKDEEAREIIAGEIARRAAPAAAAQ